MKKQPFLTNVKKWLFLYDIYNIIPKYINGGKLMKQKNRFMLKILAVIYCIAGCGFALLAILGLTSPISAILVDITSIFGYFSDLLTLYFAKDKSQANLMAMVGAKWDIQFAKFQHGMRNYNAYQVIEIISAIRDFDAKSKGVGSRQNEYDLLKDLIFHIISAPGNIDF
jgi:hypothetical protein